ncbi:hypothetical protein, conserved [Eimeria tenella]|uniref:Uncharacterized protein n=1 Tax=Eimeria tenella TaxID=5802 RepID=U6L322_EIMTE|nr:hypothetical protein, conserved [Eimeria tenella]CDJ42994.1 hypothetical protein, conserved [Eimeria tenella]|eukprot:XP_013233744.1 hypothetical protein, conserved [Eimeria tenella]
MEVPDLSQIDDEEVLTLVLLDSTHPQILRSVEKIKDRLVAIASPSTQADSTAANSSSSSSSGSSSSSNSSSSSSSSEEKEGEDFKCGRKDVEALLKRAKAVVDSSLKLTFELDEMSFKAMNPIWGAEKSVRQSRKFLVQLLEKVTSRGESVILFLSSVLDKLPSPPSPPPSPPRLLPKEEDSKEIKQSEGGRGRGRGLLMAGRGRGVPLARGSGVGISPSFLSSESEGLGSPSHLLSSKEEGGEEGPRGPRKHERDLSPEETQRRWKKKQPSNVDWMLKCKTKLLELKERTAKKAVSDVFMTERTLPETISFIDHNATKLEAVAAKNPSAFAAEDRRVFMQSIESYIAGLERALMLLAKETLNKRQLMSLFDSALKVERLTTPSELLTEMRSIISLLNTFAYMPKMDDDD